MEGATITTLVSLLGVLTGIALFYWGKYLERTSVNKAILSEVQRLIEVVRSHKDYWKSCIENGNTDLPLIPFSTPIYNEHAKNIGMLKKRLVANVAKFYGYLQFLNSLQKAKQDFAAINKSQVFNEMYLESLERFCKRYESEFNKAFESYKLI
jgi:hypothetical protein